MTELTKDAKESILSIQVNAALAGHDLGPFEPVEGLTGGYEASVERAISPLGLEILGLCCQ